MQLLDLSNIPTLPIGPRDPYRGTEMAQDPFPISVQRRVEIITLVGAWTSHPVENILLN